jgi:hypothetical protein
MVENATIIIPIRLKRSARGIMLQHMLAGIALILTVLEFLGDEENPHKIILTIEGFIAIALVIAIIRELRHLKKGHLQSSIWVDLLAASVIFCEALNKFLEHHIRLAIAWWFVALLTIVTGFIRPRVRGRRYIKINEEQILLKLWITKSEKIPIKEILSIIKTQSKIEISLKNGESWIIEFNRMLNPGEISDKLYSACSQAGMRNDTLIGFGNEGGSDSIPQNSP